MNPSHAFALLVLAAGFALSSSPARPAPAGVPAPSMPDAAFHHYLASPAFDQVLHAALPACAATAPLPLLEVQSLQPVFMGDGAHPREGLWQVTIDAQACGGPLRQRLLFWGREDQPPRAALRPLGTPMAHEGPPLQSGPVRSP